MRIAGIFAIALGLRLWGIGFSLPHFYSHPDEAHYVPVAARMTVRDLNPHYFSNPPLFTYLLFLERKVAGGLGLLGEDDPERLLTSGTLHRIARGTSAIAGALTVVPTFLLARRLGVRRPTVAAAFLAVAFLHARDSHYGVNDIFMVFLLTCASLGVSVYPLGGRRLALFVGGWLGGLGTAAKYNAGIFLGTLLLSVFLRREPARTARSLASTMLLALGFFGAGFLFGNPYAVLDWKQFSADFLLQYREFGDQPWPGQAAEPVLRLYLDALWIGMGPGMLVLSFIGIVSLVKRRQALALLLVFPVLYVAFMATRSLFFLRFALPLFPFVSIMAGEGAIYLADHVAAGPRSHLRKLMILVAVLLASIQPLAQTVRHNVLLGKTDTRLLAVDYLRSQLSAGTVVLTEGVSPPLPPSLVEVHTLKDTPLKWEEFLRQGVQVFVAQSFVEDVFRTDPRYALFYSRLRGEGELLKEFNPSPRGSPARDWVDEQIVGPLTSLWEMERPGPIVRIYKIRRDDLLR